MGLDFSHYADEMKDEKVSSVEVLRYIIRQKDGIWDEDVIEGLEDALLALEKQEKNK